VSDKDDPGIVQKHLINVARHHQQAPAQPSDKVTLTRTGAFHGAFPSTFWLAQAWSPDGSLFAAGGEVGGGHRGILHVWNGSTGHHEALSMRHLTHGLTGQVVSIAWAPDNSRLATVEVNHASGERALGVRSPAGSRTLAVPADLKVLQVAWSPDGTTLALSGPDCARTVLLDPDSGAVRRELDNLSGPVAWQPGGRLLAGRYETSVLLCDPVTGGRTGRLAGQEHQPSALAWARGGKFLAVADGERVRIWDAEAGTQTSVLPWILSEGDRGPDSTITRIDWLDDRYLYEFRPRGGALRDERNHTCSTIALWEAHEVKWQVLKHFYEHVNHVIYPVDVWAPAPDGKRCLTLPDDAPPSVWLLGGTLT
jgi:WD40 repeat protein